MTEAVARGLPSAQEVAPTQPSPLLGPCILRKVLRSQQLSHGTQDSRSKDRTSTNLLGTNAGRPLWTSVYLASYGQGGLSPAGQKIKMRL